MLVQNAMRQVHFYLLCEKCCWMTSIIWLWVQWVHQLSYYFCLCNQLLLCYSTALRRPRTHPSVPAGSRHDPMRVAIVVPPLPLLRRLPLPSPLMKILLDRCIPAKFTELKPPKNTNSWKTAELTHSSSQPADLLECYCVEQLKLMAVPSLFHLSVVIINWHTAGQIEDWISFTP